MTHQLDGFEAGRAVVTAEYEPLRMVGRFAKMELGTGLPFAEMRNTSGGQCLATHKTVARAPRPTSLERQTSHAVTQTDERADHICAPEAKAVRFFAFDGY